MEAVLASMVFWLEDAPINTSNTIYMTYTLQKAYHILGPFGLNLFLLKLKTKTENTQTK